MAPFTGAVQAAAEYWAWSIRMNNNFSMAGYAILFYDYTLTFSTEVECFWKSTHVSLFSVLFVLNRYFGVLGVIPTIIEYFGSPSEIPGDLHTAICRCRNLQTYHQAFAIASQGIIAIMLVLRTYALYERSRRILVLLIVTHVGGALAALVAMVTTKSPIETNIPLPFTLNTCNLSLTKAQGFHIAIAWAAMLWFDTTVFVLTLVRTLQMHRRMRGGVLETLLRDGTIYYGVMVVSTVGNMITFFVTPSGSNLKGMETTLTNVLSTTLTSRLILNLRDRSTLHMDGSTSMRAHAWTSTAAQSVISRVVFGREQIKHVESFELASSTEDSAAETETL